MLQEKIQGLDVGSAIAVLVACAEDPAAIVEDLAVNVLPKEREAIFKYLDEKTRGGSPIVEKAIAILTVGFIHQFRAAKELFETNGKLSKAEESVLVAVLDSLPQCKWMPDVYKWLLSHLDDFGDIQGYHDVDIVSRTLRLATLLDTRPTEIPWKCLSELSSSFREETTYLMDWLRSNRRQEPWIQERERYYAILMRIFLINEGQARTPEELLAHVDNLCGSLNELNACPDWQYSLYKVVLASLVGMAKTSTSRQLRETLNVMIITLIQRVRNLVLYCGPNAIIEFLPFASSTTASTSFFILQYEDLDFDTVVRTVAYNRVPHDLEVVYNYYTVLKQVEKKQ